MKKFSTFLLTCLLSSMCVAQEMTLPECIEQGIRRNLTLVNARLGIAKGKTTVSQSRARFLPTLDGMAQLTGYLKSPVNVTTGTLLGNDFPDNPTWQTIKSMPLNANAGVQLSVPLYNQTLLAAVDVARTVEQLSTLSYDKAVDDLTVQISKVYYLAQASLEMARLTQENIHRMSELCQITENLYQQGVVMQVDLDRVRINLQNLQTQYDQSHTLHAQQLSLLRFLIDLPADSALEVIALQEEQFTPIATSGVGENLPELRLSYQQQKLAEQRIKAVKAGYLPSLSLSGYAGALGYQEKLGNFFHTHAAKDNWFGNCFIALSLRVPLFDANAKKLQIRQHRYEAQQVANQVSLLQKQLTEQFDNASLQLRHNMEVLCTQSANRQQAESVYRVTEVQYKEGVASMTALLQDEMQLRTAQTACVQALCQCHLAQLDLLKLSGNLAKLSR